MIQKTRLAALALVPVAAAAFAAVASAQKVDPKRPRDLLVGEAKGASIMARVDPRRSGRARGAFPTGGLKVAWRRSLGASGEMMPLVTDAGDILVVSGRGDLYSMGPDGDERNPPTATGTPNPGSAVLLSDGTVVFSSPGGDVVGVRAGAVRFRTRASGDRSGVARIAPLPMADGGVIVGGGTDLLLLDGEGGVRAKATFPELLSGPLATAGGKVIVTSALGTVYTWSPGREPTRVGSFGAPVDGGAVVSEDEKSLLAVVEGNRLAELDLARGVAATRASAPAGGVLLGPPALRGAMAYVLAMIPGRTFALAFDASGAETSRAVLASSAPQASLDGGAPQLVVLPHAGPLVDANGALAFVTPEGRAGTVSASGAVETISDSVCGRTSPGAAASPALAPTPGGFLVACPNGTLAKIGGSAEK
jgi:hypothetical protein